MISALDPASELFLANLDRIQRRLADANRQVTSGKKMSQPSDAPDQIDAVLQLRADQQHNTQIRSNLGLALTKAQGADGALTSAIKLMDRALVLAAQGANSTLDATGRQSLGMEAQALLEQMVAYSQTAVQGRYIFSGDADNAAAYALNTAAPNGVNRLSTANATRRIEDPAGGSFAADQTAQNIFDHRNPDDSFAPDNVFAALNGLASALMTNDSAGITQSVANLKASSVRLNSMQGFYGNVQSRIQNATNFAARYDTDLQKQLSDKEDADVVAAALEVTQGGTQLQAAMQMRAMMPRKSLFDYIG